MFLGPLVVALPVSVIAGRFLFVLRNYEASFSRLAHLQTLGMRVDYSVAAEPENDVVRLWKARQLRLKQFRLCEDTELGFGSSSDDEELQTTERMHRRVGYRVARAVC